MSDDSTKPTEVTPDTAVVAVVKPEVEAAEAVKLSPDEAQAWLEKSEKFVKLVAGNLRYGSLTKRFVTIGGVAFLAFNPMIVGKMTEVFGVRELPKWYVPAFGLGMGGILVGAVGAAIVTLPKRTLEAVPERQAIKGLLSFEQKDAKIFKRLERGRKVQEVLDAVGTDDLRLFVLMGESGVGKSSLLQAGLMPNFGQVGFAGVYVKLSNREPLESIGKALGLDVSGSLVEMLRSAIGKTGKPIVLILDQFEQFFVQFQEEKRAEFIAELKAWYDSDIAVKILIGIRGDLSYRLIEIQQALGYSLRRSQSHLLEKFAPEEATEVLRVIAETEKWSFNKAFVEEITRDELGGKDGKIAPVEIQVLAQMMSRVPSENNRRFDKTALQKLGGVDGLLGRFLQESLKVVIGKPEQDRALKVLLALTDLDQNVRSEPLSIEQLKGLSEKVQGSPLEIAATVDWLLDSRLISPGDGDGEVMYELAHERLIPALRQVANQELTDANKANLLLDRRVNEWLGSGKSKRYLFDVKELWLLRQQRGFLEWGVQRSQKEALVKRSWGRSQKGLGVLGVPVSLGLVFGIWSHTPPGQIQWTRWHFMNMNSLGYVADTDIQENLNLTLSMDLTLARKDNLASSLWMNSLFLSPSSINGFQEIAESLKNENYEDKKSLDNILKNLENIADNRNLLHEQSILLSTTAYKYAEFQKSEDAKRAIEKSIKILKLLPNKHLQISGLIEASGVYLKIGDKENSIKQLIQAFQIVELEKEREVYIPSLIKISSTYNELGYSSMAKKTLLYTLDLFQLMPKYNDLAFAYHIRAQKLNILNEILKVSDLMEDGDKNDILVKSLNLTPMISDPYIRIESLKEISKSSIKMRNRKSIDDLISRIMDVVDDTERDFNIRDKNAINIFIEISKYYKYGSDQKGRFFNTIQSRLPRYVDDSSKCFCLDRIATLYKYLGNSKSSMLILRKAISDIKNPEASFDIDHIAKASEELSDTKERTQILVDLLKTSSNIREGYVKVDSTLKVAESYIRLSDDETAYKVIIKALDFTKKIDEKNISKPGFTQAKSIGEVVNLSLKLKDKSKTHEIFEKSLLLLAEIQNPRLKFNALNIIAENSDKISNPYLIKSILSQELTAANQLDVVQRSGALIAVAEHHRRVNDIDKAIEIIEESRRNSNISSQNGVVLNIGKFYASIGYWDRALAVRNLCLPKQQVNLLGSILRNHAEQKNRQFKYFREDNELYMKAKKEKTLLSL